MNALQRCIYGISIVSLVSMNIQCKSYKKVEETKLETKAMDLVSISKTDFGKTANGEQVDLYTLKNQKGMEMNIITYGGIITALKVPNKAGVSEDVVIGFSNLDQYAKDNPYFGALIGRF